MRVVVLEGMEDIVDEFPLHQIFRFHDRTARHRMHASADHIVDGSYPNDANVGYVRPDDRVRNGRSIHLGPALFSNFAHRRFRIPLSSWIKSFCNKHVLISRSIFYYSKPKRKAEA